MDSPQRDGRPSAWPFVATGETHVLVTDRNGQASTASDWNRHSNNNNGNDWLLEAGAITSDMMDSTAGIWFGLGEDGSVAPVNDGLGALPFGEYTLTELACEANEGLTFIVRSFWIERDSSAAEAVWMALDDQDAPKIATQAADASDGDQIAQASESVTIVDTVYYENLEFGTTYTLTGTLMVKSTGEPLLDADGNPVTATKEFTARNTNGSVDIEFTFDASLLAGESIVVFESLLKDGIEVAAHADEGDDAGQTVRFVGISSLASDAADGDKHVTGSDAVIIDEVFYEGLTPGETYALETTVMNVETGEPVQNGEDEAVTVQSSFTPQESTGTQAVEIALDVSGLGGNNLVVFERLLDSAGTVLAADENLLNESQTVTVPEIGTTLADAADGDHVVEKGTVKLIDTVEYKGLVAGQARTVHGTLLEKSSGLPLKDAEGNPVTASAEFVAEASQGSVEVVFELDTSQLEAGAALVAFEDLYGVDGTLVAEHKDLNDEGQTVVVETPGNPEGEPTTPVKVVSGDSGSDGGSGTDGSSGKGKGLPQTGDATQLWLFILMGLASACAAVAGGAEYAIRRKDF